MTVALRAACFNRVVHSRTQNLQRFDFAVIILLPGVIRTVAGFGYGPLTDVLFDGKWLRGTDASKHDADEPADIVRALYQFSSYRVSKTSWPTQALFFLLGAFALGSVLKFLDFTPRVGIR